MNEIESRFNDLKLFFRVDSIRKLSKEIGISNQRLLDFKTGRAKKLARDMVETLEKVGINHIWLETGEGEMLLPNKIATNATTDIKVSQLLPIINNNHKGVPYYSMDVTGSIVRSFSDITEEPEFYVDFPPFNDCAAYFQVYGDSMYPRFASGEIIAVKDMPTSIIWWGEPYLVVTNEIGGCMRTVKILHKHEDKDYVILRPSNPNFGGDVEIPKEAIVSLFMVKGKITRYQL